MNPWPWLALLVIGMTGSVAAIQPAVEDLRALVDIDKRGETPTRWQRWRASRWGWVGLFFSAVGVAGAGGIYVYLTR